MRKLSSTIAATSIVFFSAAYTSNGFAYTVYAFASTDPNAPIGSSQQNGATLLEASADDGNLSAFASADVGNGTFRGRVSQTNSIGERTDARSGFVDTVSFAGTNFDWDLTLRIDADATTVGQPDSIQGLVSLEVYEGSTYDPANPNEGVRLFRGTHDLQFDLEGFYLDIDFTPFAAPTQTLSVGSAPASFDIVVNMSVWCDTRANTELTSCDIDYSNTAQLILNSPEPFSSESGFLLTGDNTMVPVPAAAWLFGSALLSLLAVRHRA
ncbi:MAG: VPLPA-CTERM sorting domain-containing protein [Pseudomonadales bacterium]